MEKPKVRLYQNREKAAADAELFKKAGWPDIEARQTENGEWIISTHKAFCKCGLCPILYNDGYLK